MCWKHSVLCLGFLSFAVACSSGNSGTPCEGWIGPDGECYITGKPSVIGDQCYAHVDCKGQAACINGKCAQECTEDWQCAQPAVCDHFQCIPGTATDVTAPPKDTAPPPPPDTSTGTPCNSNFDCQGEGACINGHCGKECDTDSDCPGGGSCLQFQCVGGVVPDADSTPDTAPAPDTSSPPDTASPPDTGDPLPPGCEGKKAPYGTSCKCKEDCATGLCLGDVTQGKGLCTQECFTSSNCPGTDWCLDVGGGTKVCVANDAGVNCASGCLSTITLTNQLGQCVCTVPCEAASGCPGTMSCSEVNLGGDRNKRVRPHRRPV